MDNVRIEYICRNGKQATLIIPEGASFRDYWALRRMIKLHAELRPWNWKKKLAKPAPRGNKEPHEVN